MSTSDWDSMRIELDVAKEQVLDGRQKLHFVFRRRLEDFGSAANFSDDNPKAISSTGTGVGDAISSKKSGSSSNTVAEFAPYEDKSFNIHVTRLNKGCQISSESRDARCQTTFADTKNAWTQYAPRVMAEDECRRLIESTSMAEFVRSVEPRLHDALEEVDIVDAFGNDFQGLESKADSQ